MRVVIVNGTGGSGKDTFVKLCCETKYGVATKPKHISTVDKVKEVALTMGWTGEKTEKDRIFLSNLPRA